MREHDTRIPIQYRSLKNRYPDAVLLIRLGDFYEAFDDDADIVARVCSIQTVRHGEHRMSGMPAVALISAIRRINAAGHAVAVIDDGEAAKLWGTSANVEQLPLPEGLEALHG